MKPIIGVTPDYNAGDRKEWGGREPTYFLRGRYVRAIEELGGIPLILPLIADRAAKIRLLRDVNGLLLTGSGPDLPPALYGESQRYPFRIMSGRRSSFELDMIRLAQKSDVPVLGICGGMQAMNVACGGSLFQDISTQLPQSIQHRQSAPAVKLTHAIKIAPGSLLRRVMRTMTLRVNSSHHQSVKTVAPSLVASAVAPDGIVEAIESPDHGFFLGIQWHPEFLFDRHPLHRRLFEAFLRAASRRRT
ncbi:MAG TPA: gamma-glutamyl-gamma-aminobutyrate hydrolase family protein [Nitrospiraceae bacterium]|jgi:putative glutamine amidotransferase